MEMAQAFQGDLDPLRCPICLDPLKDPVSIPCGHSYCMSCISDCWDQEERKEGVYSCPQCRTTFTPRPVLNKNTVLAELVEKLTKIRSDSPELPYAGPGDVECDVCTGKKLKSVKSCLTCVASYCETHIQPHYESAALMKHNLTNATSKLHENICLQHNRLLEVFCRSDGKCICALCVIDEHRGHNITTVAAEMTEKKTQFEETRKQCQEMTQKRDEELLEMNKALLSYKRDAERAEQHCEGVFTKLIESIEKTRAEVKKMIRARQMEAETKAKEILQELEQEMVELKRRDAEMEQLTQEDHVHFLQIAQQIPTSYETKDFKAPHLSFELIKETISELMDEVNDYWSKTEKKMLKEGATVFLEVNEFSKLSGQVSSPAVVLENMSWSMFVRPQLENNTYLSFFLDAGSDIGSKSCHVKAIMKVINRQDDDKSFVRKITHKFCAEEPDWGFKKFVLWNDVMDPAKGFVKDDKVSFMVTFWAV